MPRARSAPLRRVRGLSGRAGWGGGEESTPEDEYAAAKKNAVPVGETVEVGDVAWTVSNVEKATELKALGERKQGTFIIINVPKLHTL